MLLVCGQIDGYSQSAFKIMDNLFDNNDNAHCVIGPWEHQFPHLSMLKGDSNINFLEYVADFVDKYSGNNKKFGLPQFCGFLQNDVYDKKMMDDDIEINGKWVGCNKWP